MLGYLFTPSDYINFKVVTLVNVFLVLCAGALYWLEQKYPKDVAGFWVIVSINIQSLLLPSLHNYILTSVPMRIMPLALLFHPIIPCHCRSQPLPCLPVALYTGVLWAIQAGGNKEKATVPDEKEGDSSSEGKKNR